MKPWRRRLTAEGLNIERLICQAAGRNIELASLRRNGSKRISAQVAEDDIPLFRELAQQGGWVVHEGERLGLGRWADKLSRRRAAAAACAVLLVLLYASALLIWRIEIINGGRYEADIRAYLSGLDIRPFRLKAMIDPGDLREKLEWRYPEVAWIECGWRGMTLCIIVHEGIIEDEALTWTGAGDVIAKRDGIIDSLITLAGTPQVKRGDIVRKGDVLILGEERTSQGGIRPVSARGKVYARVWDGAKVQFSANELESVYSGRVSHGYTASLPWFDLWLPEPSAFEQEDVSVRTHPLGGIFLPFVFRSETKYEVQTYTRKRDEAQLRSEAGLAAMRKLKMSVENSDEFLTKWVEYSMIDDEVMCALAIGERVIDIGQAWPRAQQ